MVGKLQSFAFFLILLIFFGLSFLHGMARPLNSLGLHRDLDVNQELKKNIAVVGSSPHMVVLEGRHGQKKNLVTRTLEVTNSGPSPGEGHKY